MIVIICGLLIAQILQDIMLMHLNAWQSFYLKTVNATYNKEFTIHLFSLALCDIIPYVNLQSVADCLEY